MTVRRGLGYFFAFFGVLLLCCALYLAFGDLSQHKHRIESFITQRTGRAFAIDGAFRIELFPSVVLHAERVRFANAEWGSKPQMVQVGRVSAQVGFWSLLSGPIDVRAFELKDVTVLLERRGSDKVNWHMGAPAARDADVEAEPKTRTQVPVVIEKAELTNVRLTYRALGKPDLLARLDTLTITPGKNGLLALDGSGKLDQYPISLHGEAGPVEALLSGRDIRGTLKGTVGRLGLDIKGGFGRLDPLDGADLRIKATGEDVGAMLERLNLPVIVTGALKIDATLADAGKRTRLDLNATAGDVSATVNGSLSGLYLRGSVLDFKASAADAARLAGVFRLSGVPAAPLTASGKVTPSRKEIQFEAIRMELAGVTARLDGKLQRKRDPVASFQFELGVENLATLRADLPQSKLSAKGNFTAGADKVELRDLQATLDGNEFTGWFSMTRSHPRRIDAELISQRVDLTPYFPQPVPDAAAPANTKKEPSAAAPRRKWLFDEAPLPILELRGTESKLHVASAEVVLADKSLKDVDARLLVASDHVTIDASARGSFGGEVNASLTLEPTADSGANVLMKVDAKNVRAGFEIADMSPDEVPPVNMELLINSHGASPRQMASNSNGHILLTQGAGKTRSGFLNLLGGDVLNELRGKLNPFAAQDPYTRLECSVVRADIVDGQATVKPVLLQTQKVTVVAHGKVDLHTEQLTFDFDTRPRKGIGVSPGMFSNPFIRLEGKLTHPRVGVGAKGMTSGAVAAATGGLSVLASGVIDRLKGEANMCRRALEQATEAKPAPR